MLGSARLSQSLVALPFSFRGERCKQVEPGGTRQVRDGYTRKAMLKSERTCMAGKSQQVGPRNIYNMKIYSGPRKRNRSDDDEVNSLSHQRHLLRQQLNSNKSLDRTNLRSSVNHLTNQIQKRLSAIRSAAADAICNTITTTVAQ